MPAGTPYFALFMERLILNSWKEIAHYMGRGVRTIQRWERDLNLPIRRPAGKSRSAVLAFSDEIDLWMRSGPVRVHANGDATSENGNSKTPVRLSALPQWQR